MAQLTSNLVTKILVESLRVPGARTPARLASWIKDTPELKLNLWLLEEAFLQLLASGLGTLALVWATVVLLGGYSTSLVKMDFWFTTAIVFVETARIVGYNSAPEAKFFVDLPAALSQKDIKATKFVRLLAMGPTWVALAPIFLAIACTSLSLIRLDDITNPRRHEYGGPNNGNLKPALILFYSLVLTQGVLFIRWFAVAMKRLHVAEHLAGSKYLANELLRKKKNLENSSRNKEVNEEMELIDRYVNSIADTCIQNGVSGTINTTLVSFAAELLLQSQHPNDHISAVSVLHSLVVKNKKRSDTAVDQICSSENLVCCRLVQMLRSTKSLVSIPQRRRETVQRQTKNLDPIPQTKILDLDADIKAHIAEIVAKLACKLRLADMPGAAHCISSLLDSHSISMKVRKAAGRSNDDVNKPQPRPRGGVNQLRTTDDIESEMSRDLEEEETSKPLFLHGLVILRELAADPENCTEMYNTMDLVPKIIAPISNGLLMAIKNDETTVDIVRESLRVVCKLTTSGTEGESSRKLCRELTTTKYGRTAENILWILSNTSDQEMGERATEILSRLTLSKQTMRDFVVVLQRLLVDPDQHSPLRTEAGKALSALVRSRGDEFRDKFPDIHQLLTVMCAAADAYSKEYRVVTAEMLAKICAKSTADEDRNRLSSLVSNALSMVLKAIVTETTDITVLDKMNMKFLASFLGLAVQIREKLATPEAFANAVTGLPMEDNILAEKLKRIIEMTTNDSESEDDEVCLAIIKSTTKLVTWMMVEMDTTSPGLLLLLEEIVEKLEAAVKSMIHLERYVVMTTGGVYDAKEGYVTLETLVETARNKLVSLRRQQQQI